MAVQVALHRALTGAPTAEVQAATQPVIHDGLQTAAAAGVHPAVLQATVHDAVQSVVHDAANAGHLDVSIAAAKMQNAVANAVQSAIVQTAAANAVQSASAQSKQAAPLVRQSTGLSYDKLASFRRIEQLELQNWLLYNKKDVDFGECAWGSIASLTSAGDPHYNHPVMYLRAAAGGPIIYLPWRHGDLFKGDFGYFFRLSAEGQVQVSELPLADANGAVRNQPTDATRAFRPYASVDMSDAVAVKVKALLLACASRQ